MNGAIDVLVVAAVVVWLLRLAAKRVLRHVGETIMEQYRPEVPEEFREWEQELREPVDGHRWY